MPKVSVHTAPGKSIVVNLPCRATVTLEVAVAANMQRKIATTDLIVCSTRISHLLVSRVRSIQVRV